MVDDITIVIAFLDVGAGTQQSAAVDESANSGVVPAAIARNH